MKLFWKIHRLFLRETFAIAYGNYDFRDALTVQLTYENVSGFGECVEINYYQINFDEFIAKLASLKTQFEKQDLLHPIDFFEFLSRLNLHPFLLSALDCAYWDLYGKLENRSFAELNSIPTATLPESSLTISIASVTEQIHKIEKSAWKRFKVKCNGFSQQNFEKLIALDCPVALDSNASFTEEDCIWLQENHDSSKLLYVEQPLETGNYHILKNSGFANWMADEDFQNVHFLEKLKPHYSCINIKLMKSGGLTPALEIIAKAKMMDYKIMVGCMTESSVGISAGIAIAPLCDFADLDGANLISNDYAFGSFVENGILHLSEKPGLGISLV